MNSRLPEEFLNRMRQQLGDDLDEYLSAMDQPPVRSLRLNRRKIFPVDYARTSRICAGSDTPEPVIFCEGAYYYEDYEPGKSSLHEAGAYYIQEASAMLPATLLDATDSGQKILDLCAAPGGKSTQIADLMCGRGLLVSNEIMSNRASVLSENIERLGVENALVLNHDPNELAVRFPAFFDRILVDAPCSGEGLFRRQPEAVSQWSLENVKMCADRQDMILDCAAAMLAPSGKIVYSTCTFSPEEDEGSTERFLSRHPEFEICDEPKHLYPQSAKCEGHFAVSFVRKDFFDAANTVNAGIDATQKVKNNVISSIEKTLLSSFLNETLTEKCPHRRLIEEQSGRIVRFGDSIYLAPEYLPDLTGLKVKRAGLKLGTFMKNRFEPDHALSHALTPDEVRFSVDLPHDSMEIKQYLGGMTINCDKDMKGWCIVCTEGFALGWGKAGGGVVKNHYPKGLRISI